MTEKILKNCAFALLAVFLGILFFWVPRFDLGLVLGATLVLAFVDFFVKDPKR